MEDWQLLRQFVDEGSRAAFDRLMARHRGLVYSTCRRELGSGALAEDATQVVFLILAQKAKSLRREVVLSGWLFQTARFAARDLRKNEQRQRARDEQAGVEMHEAAERTQESVWKKIDPKLHDSLDRLGSKDREAVLLRFFEDKSFAEIASALGQQEDAARHRVNRALEKMRRFLAAQGVVVPADTLGTLLAAYALDPAAPPADFSSAASGIRLSQITHGVSKTMKMKQIGGLAAAAVLGVGVLSAGTGLVRAFTLPAASRVSSLAAPVQRPSSSPRVLAAAGQKQQRRLSEIRITGNKIVPTAAIMTILGVKAGDTVSDGQIRRALSHLYGRNWFEEVGPSRTELGTGGGTVLTIPVVERSRLAVSSPDDFQQQAEIAAVYDRAEDAVYDRRPDQFKALFSPEFSAIDRAGRQMTPAEYLALFNGPLGTAAPARVYHSPVVTVGGHTGNFRVIPVDLTWYRWERLPGGNGAQVEKLEQSVEDEWRKSSSGWSLKTRKLTSPLRMTTDQKLP